MTALIQFCTGYETAALLEKLGNLYGKSASQAAKKIVSHVLETMTESEVKRILEE